MNSFRISERLKGFTLIELMIVVAIMAILATAAMPLRELMVKREKEQELRMALRQIRTAIDAYKQAADDGRIEKKADESGYPPRLEELFMGVKDVKSKEKKVIYFLRRLPRDPMFVELDVAGTTATPDVDTWGRRSYESPADSPKEGDDVFDVFSRSEAIGLNGIPYRDW
ncbi:MAG TPA: type II secretion system protein [Nitrosomonas sp.]|jgi:general secretion pathway protein G|nr:type II secretion system protein [Nitrosomonas sp.]MBP6366508.1 type II secretion system protein [Nitrosomonas sp.]MBP7113571.1 type II secretion system protein [Nitrosomonas sp.]MBP9871646.1 type II secretion system protein [Nitrosomonas sp.]HQV89660.1 type II secretion system protein [Nitrosomonas sp.]